MALSPQWGQSVVVRADTRGDVVVPPAPSANAARAYAAAGNPIIIRSREDPQNFDDLQSRNGGRDGATDGAANAVTGALIATFVGRDISGTFWVPDSSKNEKGLLEILALRGSNNKNNVLLQSRPLLELKYNFSTVNNNNIDLSHNCFRLSKTAMAVHQMDRTIGEVEEEYDQYYNGSPHYNSNNGSPSSRGGGPTVSMSARDFKQTIRSSLQSIQEEDYYLVRYRDYSTWATQQYRALAKSDSYFGKKYVEQCFAVHVGREAGELLVITEEQFLFGIDILQRQLLNQVMNMPSGSSGAGSARRGTGEQNAQNYYQNQMDIDYCALNADQFRSLGAVLGDGMRQVLVEGEEKKKKAEEEERQRSGYGAANSSYVAPAWWDWSPAAVRARVQHQLSYYYTSIGKLAVQLIVVGCFAYVGYSYVRGLLPAGSEDADVGRRGGRGRGRDRRGGRGGNSGRGGGYDDDDDRYYRKTFFRSLMFGPKEVFDYLLAPSDE